MSDSEEEQKKEQLRVWEQFLDEDADRIRQLEPIDWSEDEDERMTRDILRTDDPVTRIADLLDRQQVAMAHRDSLCSLIQTIASSIYFQGYSTVDILDIQVQSLECTRALHEFLTMMETPTKNLCINIWHEANTFRTSRLNWFDEESKQKQ